MAGDSRDGERVLPWGGEIRRSRSQAWVWGVRGWCAEERAEACCVSIPPLFPAGSSLACPYTGEGPTVTVRETGRSESTQIVHRAEGNRSHAPASCFCSSPGPLFYFLDRYMLAILKV